MDLPDARRQAMYLGRLRFAVGLSMLATPGRSARVWSGSGGPGARLWTRMTGVRELAVGAGTSIAAGERTAASWISMSGLIDIGDGVIAVLSRGVPFRTRVFGLAVLGIGAAQIQLSRQLAEEEQATTL